MWWAQAAKQWLWFARETVYRRQVALPRTSSDYTMYTGWANQRAGGGVASQPVSRVVSADLLQRITPVFEAPTLDDSTPTDDPTDVEPLAVVGEADQDTGTA
eukprot:3542225-Pyramimonas_sp.AAC.3